MSCLHCPELQNEFGQGSGGSYDPYSGHSWGPKIADLANDPTYGGNTDNAFTQKMGKRQGQYYVPQRAEAGLDPWATPKAYNNMKDFFDTGITWSNNVNVSQNLDKGNYSFSLGNSHQEGIIPTTGMDRYNAKMSAEVQLSPNWSTGFNGNFVTSKIKKQSTANSGVTATIYNASGELQHERNPLARRRRPVRAEHVPPGMDRRRLLGCGQQSVHRTPRNVSSGNAFVKFTTKFGTDNHKLDVKYQLGDDRLHHQLTAKSTDTAVQWQTPATPSNTTTASTS